MKATEQPGEADRRQINWLRKHMPILLVGIILGACLGPLFWWWFDGGPGGGIALVVGAVAGLILATPLQLLWLFVRWCWRRMPSATKTRRSRRW